MINKQLDTLREVILLQCNLYKKKIKQKKMIIDSPKLQKIVKKEYSNYHF